MLSGLPGILGELTTETNHFCSSMKKKKNTSSQAKTFHITTRLKLRLPLMDPNPGVLGPNADFLWLSPLRHVVTSSRVPE